MIIPWSMLPASHLGFSKSRIARVHNLEITDLKVEKSVFKKKGFSAILIFWSGSGGGKTNSLSIIYRDLWCPCEFVGRVLSIL